MKMIDACVICSSLEEQVVLLYIEKAKYPLCRARTNHVFHCTCAMQAPDPDKLVARLAHICDEERVAVDRSVSRVPPLLHVWLLERPCLQFSTGLPFAVGMSKLVLHKPA